MDQRQRSRASLWCDQAPASGAWSLSRLEVVSTIQPRRWPVGRVELRHATQGCISDVATGAGSMDAIFNALARLFNLEASVKTLSAQYEQPEGDQTDLPRVAARTELLIDGKTYCGSAESEDLLLSTAGAYLDALLKAAEERKLDTASLAS